MSEETATNPPTLTGKKEFRFLAELALKHATGNHVLISLNDQHGGTTRFANNQVVQNVNRRRGCLTITAAFGQCHGTASTTDLNLSNYTSVY